MAFFLPRVSSCIFKNQINRSLPICGVSPSILLQTLNLNSRRHSSTNIQNNSVSDTDIVGETKRRATELSPLRLSQDLYAIFKIHNRPYLVTKGDKVILPFKLKQGNVGDILTLTDVIKIGSRNFTFVGNPIDPSLYTIKAVITEKTKRKFQVKEVTKRRNRRTRHAVNKADMTILRVSELKVN